MASPREWSNSEEFLADLRRCDWASYFNNWRFRAELNDWETIIVRLVGGTTFRAFHHMPERPSIVFRSWAREALKPTSRLLKTLNDVNSAAQYDEWLQGLAGDLRQQWNVRMQSEMPFGISLKLPSLLMKGACMSATLVPNDKFEEMISYLHVPLDSYSIVAIRNCVSMFPSAEKVGSISKKASMGSIKTASMYDAIQEGMRVLAARAEVPAIAVDILTWNNAH